MLLRRAQDTIGTQGLLAFGFFTERAWIWAGVGYMLGLALGEA